jgi:hypothetical protein
MEKYGKEQNELMHIMSLVHKLASEPTLSVSISRELDRVYWAMADIHDKAE